MCHVLYPHPLRSASFTPVNRKCSSSLEENIFFSLFSFLDMIFFTLASWQKQADEERIWEPQALKWIICCMLGSISRLPTCEWVMLPEDSDFIKSTLWEFGKNGWMFRVMKGHYLKSVTKLCKLCKKKNRKGRCQTNPYLQLIYALIHFLP